MKPSTGLSVVNFILGRLHLLFVSTIVLLSCRTAQSQSCQEYPGTSIECDQMGFAGAKVNKCGFCVGGNTGLAEDFGKDCKGVCSGVAMLDCMGVCGGSAYLDPCSFECIDKDWVRTIESQGVYRDCSGQCLELGPKVPPPTFTNDSCGVCVRAGGGVSKDSAYKDCTGTCYLPSEKAKRAEQKCGHCIGGSSPNKRSDFVNECGGCKSQKAVCECENGIVKDICGICGGKAGSCLKATQIKPIAAPANKPLEVTLYGAFSGEAPSEMVCVFRNASDPDAPVVGSPSPGVGNGHLTPVNGKVSFMCKVKELPEGEYFVNPRLSRLGKEEHRNLTLRVFDSSISYAKMEPTSAPYRRIENKDATIIRLKFSGGNVPKYPLYCRLESLQDPKQKVAVYPSESAHLLNECEIPLPSKSEEYIVYPSLDGLNPMSTNFTFSFYATRPLIKQSYMHSDGSAAIVIFDRDVDIAFLTRCDDILTEETLKALGGPNYLVCRWATKHQLVIFLSKREKNSVRLYLRSSNFREDGQTVFQDIGDELKTDAKVIDAKDSPIYVAITGPNVIPYCGDFELFAHYSWANGVPEVFQWSVARNDSMKITDKEPLGNGIKRTTGATLSLQSEYFEIGVEYTFTLKLGQGKNGGEAMHRLIRHENPGPMVLLYSTTMLQLEPVTVSQSDIVIYVETIITDPKRCPNDTFQEIKCSWRVDRPDVKLDPCSLDSGTVYRVQPLTLPPNANVTFTVRAFMYEFQDDGEEVLSFREHYSESSVTLAVAPTKLKAVLRGTPVREVALGSSMNHYSVILDATPSLHSTIPVTYFWRCVDEKHNPCYDFGPRAKPSLLVNPLELNNPMLNISTGNIEPEKALNFSVTLYRANNGSASEPSTASVLVNTLAHAAPMAWLHEIRVRDSAIFDFDHNSRSLTVPAGQPVMLHVKYRFVHQNRVQTHWDVDGFPTNYGSIGSRSGHEGDSFLSLPEGSTVAHGQYKIGMRICEGKEHCTQIKVNLLAKPGVALCRVTIPSLEETLEVYNRTDTYVSGCSVPLGIHPLTYQLFVQRGSMSWLPVSTVQHSPLIPFYVPLPIDGETTLAVSVCDRFEQCSFFYNKSLPTIDSNNETYSREEMTFHIRRLVSADRHLEAAAILVSVSLGRREINELALSPAEKQEVFETNEQLLTSVFVSTSKKDLSPGEINLMYECMKLVMLGGTVDQKAGAIEATGAITDQVMYNKIEVGLTAMQEAYKAVRMCGQQHKTDPQIKRNVEYAQKIIETVIASRLPKGQTLRIVTDITTVIQHRFPTREPIVFPSTAPVNSSREGIPDAVIHFKKNINEMFNSWNCGSGGEKKICNAVVIVANVYGYNPFSDNPRGTMISPVASITFRKPDTGEEHKMSGLKDAVLIHFRQIANFTKTAGYISSCYKWHERNEEWGVDEVKLLGTAGSVIQCTTEGSGSFIVFNEKEGLSIAAIAGIVVAFLMSVFIVAAVMMFMMHKKQAQEAVLKNARQNGKQKTNAVAPTF